VGNTQVPSVNQLRKKIHIVPGTKHNQRRCCVVAITNLSMKNIRMLGIRVYQRLIADTHIIMYVSR